MGGDGATLATGFFDLFDARIISNKPSSVRKAVLKKREIIRTTLGQKYGNVHDITKYKRRENNKLARAFWPSQTSVHQCLHHIEDNSAKNMSETTSYEAISNLVIKIITVFLLTDPVQRPPWRLIRSSASSLSKLENRTMKTS